jgi:exodeoxyribonuclease-3
VNVNGLRSGVRRGFGPWLRRRRPDVLCLQELRLAPEHEPAGELDRPRVGGGVEPRGQARLQRVAVWSREKALDVRKGSGLGWSDLEGRVITDGLPAVRVASVYVPSGARGARPGSQGRVLEHFLEFTRALLADGRPTVFCGDLNIAHTELDIHNASANKRSSGFLPHERAWMDALLAQGWVDVYRKVHPESREYSWWSNYGRARELDRGWRLDYQIATPDLAERAVAARIERKAGLSDHAPVTITYRR